MDSFHERLPVIRSNRASTSGTKRKSCTSLAASSNAKYHVWNQFWDVMCVSVIIQRPPNKIPGSIGPGLRRPKSCQNSGPSRPFHAALKARSGPQGSGNALRSDATRVVEESRWNRDKTTQNTQTEQRYRLEMKESTKVTIANRTSALVHGKNMINLNNGWALLGFCWSAKALTMRLA